MEEDSIARDGFTIEEAYGSASPDQQTVGPIKHEEFLVAGEDMKQLRADIDKALALANMNTNGISRLESLLMGIDGKGGILDRLDDGQAEIKGLLSKLSDSLQGLMSLHVNDVNDLNRRIDSNTVNIQSTTIKAETAVDAIKKHTDEHEKNEESTRKKWGARSWDLFKSLLFVAIGLFSGRLL